MSHSKKHIVYAKPEFPIFFETDSKSFYKYLGEVDFSSITEDGLSRLKEKGKELRKESGIHNINSNLELKKKYTDLMNKLKTNPKGYEINSNTEMYLLFMFAIDENLDMIKSAIAVSKLGMSIENQRKHLKEEFGLVDCNLIKFEKELAEYLLNKKQKNANKRV